MSLNECILSILGSQYVLVDGLRSELKVARAELDAELRSMEQHGGVEFTGPSRLYVRATGRWFTEAA